MKDPLRYYLAEGWMVLFYAPDPESFGHFTGAYRHTNLMSDKLKVEEVKGKRCLVITDINDKNNRVAYPINSDFFLDYGIRCENEHEMKCKASEWCNEFNSFAAEFREIQKELEYA